MVCLQLWHRVFWGHVSKVQLLLWPAWLGWFNHLEKHSNKFFWGYGCCWGSRFSLCIFDKLRWITVGLQSCMNISSKKFLPFKFSLIWRFQLLYLSKTSSFIYHIAPKVHFAWKYLLMLVYGYKWRMPFWYLLGDLLQRCCMQELFQLSQQIEQHCHWSA